MNTFFAQLPPGFLMQVLAGMRVNLQIASLALVIGLALGTPPAFARLRHGVLGAICAGIMGLMRAAPTFVVMFFLLDAIPPHIYLFGKSFTLSSMMIVVLSLVPFSTYYVAESGAESINQLRLHSPLAALLFFPNLVRAFFVLVMASSSGAAIGVHESITTILRQSERMSDPGDRLALFALGAMLFGITLQTGFALVNLLRRHLIGLVTRQMAVAAMADRKELDGYE
jgi:hypothetical protein